VINLQSKQLRAAIFAAFNIQESIKGLLLGRRNCLTVKEAFAIDLVGKHLQLADAPHALDKLQLTVLTTHSNEFLVAFIFDVALPSFY
jgi:hypothetical protein